MCSLKKETLELISLFPSHLLNLRKLSQMIPFLQITSQAASLVWNNLPLHHTFGKKKNNFLHRALANMAKFYFPF